MAVETFVRTQTSGRKIAVIGDMLELGDHAVLDAVCRAVSVRVVDHPGADLLSCLLKGDGHVR